MDVGGLRWVLFAVCVLCIVLLSVVLPLATLIYRLACSGWRSPSRPPTTSRSSITARRCR